MSPLLKTIRVTTAMVLAKAARDESARARRTAFRVFDAQRKRLEAELERVLVPFFKKQIASAVEKMQLSAKSEKCGGRGGKPGPCPDPLAKLNKTQRNALQDYSTDKFQQVNSALRTGKLDKATKRIVDGVDSALRTAEKRPGSTVRSFDIPSGTEGDSIRKMLQSGGTFTDAAYVSTRKIPTATDRAAFVDRHAPANRVVMRVEGKSGVDISSVSKNPGEGEVLYPRGTKFNVDKVVHLDNGSILAMVSEIGNQKGEKNAGGQENQPTHRTAPGIESGGRRDFGWGLGSDWEGTGQKGIGEAYFTPAAWDRELIQTVFPVIAKASAEAGLAGYLEAEKQIANRGKSLRKIERKVFCATGPGGGVDPTCSHGGGSGGQTSSPEFKAWFGDSKIVGEDGSPLVVYHGTSKEFTTFDPGARGKYSSRDYGIYLTPSEKKADAYGSGKKMALYVSIKNPKIVESKGEISPRDLTKADVDKLISEGYDGIVVVNHQYNDKWEVVSRDPIWKANEIVAFHSNQVKSATKNEGTFDPTNPDITKSTKASTATDWLIQEGLDVPDEAEFVTPYGKVTLGFLTEYPEWLKKRIEAMLAETFSMPYWSGINQTTGGDIDRLLTEGLVDGKSIEQMASEMESLYGSSSYPMQRGRLIARTESCGALNGSRSSVIDGLIQDLGMQAVIKKIWLSVLGNTTRDTHANLDSVPAGSDGCWWLGGIRCRWPGDVRLKSSERCNCFPGNVLVSGRFNGAQRVWYDGIVTEIVTVSGGRLTVTPNHPVMTGKGWVAAGKINPGEKILAHRIKADTLSNLPTWETSVRPLELCDQINHKPPMIEEVFEAFLAGSTHSTSYFGGIETRRAQMDDFYGDGKSIQGNIEIVRTNWKLLQDGKFTSIEKRSDLIFLLENSELFLESGDCSETFDCNPVLLTASGNPCLANPQTRRSLGRVSPSGSLAIGIAADFDPHFLKPSHKDLSRHSGNLAEALHRDSGFVLSNEVVNVGGRDFSQLPLPTTPVDPNPGFLQTPNDSRIGDGERLADFGSGFSGVVKFDEVTDVFHRQFSGHVYDLQSDFGIIVAGDPGSDFGITVSNCQCTVFTQLGMQDDEAADLISEYDAREAARLKKSFAAEKTKHEYASTQFDLEDAGYSRSQGNPTFGILPGMANRIPDGELAEDGRETEFHITVKFGLHDHDPMRLVEVVRGFGSVRVRLGKTSIFPAKEGADYDVVKIDVEGEDLHRLNKLITDSVPNTTTHPTYRPHITLAYVKAGLGEKYAGNIEVEGFVLDFDVLTFSDKNRNHFKIDLERPVNGIRKQYAEFDFHP